MDVPATTSAGDTHSHSLPDGSGNSGGTVGGTSRSNRGNAYNPNTSSDSHSHSVNFGNTASYGGSHSHTFSLSFSSNNESGHVHSVDVGSFSTGSAGSGGALDKRPPYVALLYCQKN